jgi:hypothetical protein
VIQKLRLGHHPVGMSVQIGQHVIGPCAERKVRTVQPRHALIAEDIELHLSPMIVGEPQRCMPIHDLSNRAAASASRSTKRKRPCTAMRAGPPGDSGPGGDLGTVRPGHGAAEPSAARHGRAPRSARDRPVAAVRSCREPQAAGQHQVQAARYGDRAGSRHVRTLVRRVTLVLRVPALAGDIHSFSHPRRPRKKKGPARGGAL